MRHHLDVDTGAAELDSDIRIPFILAIAVIHRRSLFLIIAVTGRLSAIIREDPPPFDAKKRDDGDKIIRRISRR